MKILISELCILIHVYSYNFTEKVKVCSCNCRNLACFTSLVLEGCILVISKRTLFDLGDKPESQSMLPVVDAI